MDGRTDCPPFINQQPCTLPCALTPHVIELTVMNNIASRLLDCPNHALVIDDAGDYVVVYSDAVDTTYVQHYSLDPAGPPARPGRTRTL
jgi:hypothetical protein